jgi:hypothetical protein
MPRKSGSTERMHKILIQLYEQAKVASKEKNQTKAILTVEEMAHHAGITRQTMYDYIRRWTDLDLITKTSYIAIDGKAVIGYRLNGPTLEKAFNKASTKIQNHLALTKQYIDELQKLLKNEKISKSFSDQRPTTENNDSSSTEEATA